MTQLTEKECRICGLAIGKCNLVTQFAGEGFWVDATREEMQDLLKKLEQIQKEAKEARLKQGKKH